MQFTTVLAVLFVSVFAVVAYAAPNSPPLACGVQEHVEMPCVCCKKDCWFSVASAATHELGHMPGEAGEREAMATLRLIRVCMMTECSEICSRSPF